MFDPISNFYVSQPEPNQSCLLAVRKIILDHNKSLTEHWKYGAPFFYYKQKMFCYFWINKKTGLPYIGIADGMQLDFPELIQEKRARMKILNLNPHKDLPIKKIKAILDAAIKVKEER
jgi:hypothetical protein